MQPVGRPVCNVGQENFNILCKWNESEAEIYPVQGPRRKGAQGGHASFCLSNISVFGIFTNIILIINDYSNIGNLYQNLGPRAVAATGARGFLPLQIFQPC